MTTFFVCVQFECRNCAAQQPYGLVYLAVPTQNSGSVDKNSWIWWAVVKSRLSLRQRFLPLFLWCVGMGCLKSKLSPTLIPLFFQGLLSDLFGLAQSLRCIFQCLFASVVAFSALALAFSALALAFSALAVALSAFSWA